MLTKDSATISSLKSDWIVQSLISRGGGFAMRHISSIFNGLAKSFPLGRGKNCCADDDTGREAAESLAKEAKKSNLLVCSSGAVNASGSKNIASIFSHRGMKGMNQDCMVVWEEFGCQEDTIFCGVFDGHGPWGHYVSKRVRESLPSALLCQWQEILAKTSVTSDIELGLSKKIHAFDIWQQSYLRTCAIIDKELEQHRGMDCFNSGTTAVTIVKQGELIVLANVGDSRAVLGTTSDDGSLVAVQLTLDFKPSLPQEAERITKCKGRVFCLNDEPGVQRVWLPDEESPGLAMSRAFGDYCVKDFGVISVPEVTHRNLTNTDQFVVLATDGVWDVISNQEAVDIVSSAPERQKSAKKLVECAVRAWRRKRPGLAADDCSAICLFFNSPSQPVHPL